MACRALTDAEVAYMLGHTTSLRDQALIILGVKTGFRISELLSLTVADVQGDTLTVRRCNMKGKHSSRTVPLHAEAKRIVLEYIRMHSVSNLLFPITRQWAWRIIKDAAAGLGGRISTHSMRKSFGMRVYTKTGKDIVAAQRALGHKSLASTSHYLSVGQDVIDRAILED